MDLGLDLSPSGLIAGTVISGIGMGLFLYGKRSARIPQLLTGLVLMGLPLFVSGALAMSAVCAAIVGGMWAFVRYTA